MKTFPSLVYWMPFIWVLLQAYLFVFLAVFFLRWKKLLVTPLAGMEYGDIAVAGSILFGILIISTGGIGAAFQTTRTLENAGGKPMVNILIKFSQIFLAGFITTLIYIVLVIVNRKLFFKNNIDDGINAGNLPFRILQALLNIGIAIVCWFWLKELAELITPIYVNFR